MPGVLVTGASGFIGRDLCRRLVEDGWLVRGAVRSGNSVINLPAGVEPFPVGEVGPDTEWSNALRDMDAVVHLAAKVPGHEDTLADWDDFFRVNVSGTLRLAREVASAGIRKMVFLSSAKVHGEGRADPYREGDDPAPMGVYPLSKWQAEQALQELTRAGVLDLIILRPPLVYGPEVAGGFRRMLQWIDRGYPIPVASSAPRRSMISRHNLVDAVSYCLNHQSAEGNTFLVSDGKAEPLVTILHQIADMMERKLRLVPLSPVLLKFLGKLSGKTAQTERFTVSFLVEDSLIQRTLGWRPVLKQEDGLRQTVNWYLSWKR